MNLLVLGATGGTGIEIIKSAVQRGHSVTAFVRSGKRLAEFASAIDVIEGNLLNEPELASVITDKHAVLSAFGPRNPKSHERLVGPFARLLRNAMEQNQTSRLIILSVAFLFRDSILPPAYPIGQLLFKNHVADCAEMEATVRASALRWTIVRPPQLTNKPASGKCRVRVGHLPFLGLTASRADVANFMIDAAAQNSHVREIVGVAN